MRVLIAGVYRTDVPSLWRETRDELAATDHEIVQHWRQANGPKFKGINRLLCGLSGHAWDFFDCVMVVDDDVRLPRGFLDVYLAAAEANGLALAQPARTLGSSFDHPITLQRPGSVCRLTRFVEIGPVFSIRSVLYDALLPFDESSPMGWGYDLVWPVEVERLGLRMGVVDAAPVDHSFRPSHSYDESLNRGMMKSYLSRREHLTLEEAYGEAQAQVEQPAGDPARRAARAERAVQKGPRGEGRTAQDRQ